MSKKDGSIDIQILLTGLFNDCDALELSFPLPPHLCILGGLEVLNLWTAPCVSIVLVLGNVESRIKLYEANQNAFLLRRLK